MQKSENAPIMFLKRRSAVQPFALLVCLLLSVAAWSQIAYVTDGSGQDILAVSSGGVTTVAKINKKFGAPLQVRVGGDNLLYVVTPTNILRMMQDGTNLQTVFAAGKHGPSGFTGIRFDSQGNLYANTPSGVIEIAGVIQATTSFNSQTPLTSQSCSAAGDLAFAANGDLLIACSVVGGNAVYLCSGLSLPGSCTHLTNNVLSAGPGAVANISGPVVGLAVDSLGDIITSSGSAVSFIGPICGPNLSPCTIEFSTDIPAYLEAVPDPPGTAAVAPNPAPCNSASPSILVSTAINGGSGKVWSVNTIDSSNCTSLGLAKPANPLATLSTSVPAIGLAAPATLHTLTKPTSEAIPTSTFNYGPASIGLTPTLGTNQSTIFSRACNLSMTKEQLQVSSVVASLANNDAFLPVSAITLFGEQSWVTGFHGAYPSTLVNPKSCLNDPTARTHIEISGFYPFVNPHIVLIPDDGSAAHVDELPFIYPIAPINGPVGDPIVRNLSTFTTAPATIILADVGFKNNSGNPYVFCGFLSPFVEPPTNKKNANVVNSGQSATFKFQLGVGSCSKLVDDATAEQIGTGFSVAQFADAGGNAAFAEANGAGKGNSVTPPKFKYDATGHLFLYTLDTTNYCNGSFEATANGDSFQPHTLIFTVVGASSSCSTQ